MITLALDTATPAPSLALVRDGTPLAERSLTPSVGAGRRVAEEVHRLLQDADRTVADIGRIVVGVGPGGFTGIRIGIATALGLGQALQIPVVGVASIEALACGLVEACAPGALVMPVIDAKRHEVFAGVYRGSGDGSLDTVVEPAALTGTGLADLLLGLDAQVTLAGDGLGRAADVIGGDVLALSPGDPRHAISALRLAQRADRGGARPVAPLYLRLPDAEVNRLRREQEAAAP